MKMNVLFFLPKHQEEEQLTYQVQIKPKKSGNEAIDFLVKEGRKEESMISPYYIMRCFQ
jgi:hypothetical protein